MLSERTLRLIKLRLAIIKYSGCSVIHCDTKKEEVVLPHNFIYWTWCISYYTGIMICPVLLGILYFYAEEEKERLNSGDSEGSDADRKQRGIKNLAMTFLLAATAIVIFCSLIVSILKASKRDACAFYGACFKLDKVIQGKS